MIDKEPKKYIGKIEKTIYVVETVEVIAESEDDAEDMIEDGQGNVIYSEIQEETIDKSWVDSSEPLGADEFIEFHDNK